MEIRDEIFSREATPQERRRYALLQAAMEVYAEGHMELMMAIDIAEKMLAEIERREK